MSEKLKEELVALHAQGLTDLRLAAKWLELLTAHVAALEARVVAPTQDTALSILNQENEHLRAEIATLKALNAGQHAANVAQRQELAMLRPLLVDGAPSVPGWPTPQPIETAPLGKIMVCGEAPWHPVESPPQARDIVWWRKQLTNFNNTHWLPMPPPPGGAA